MSRLLYEEDEEGTPDIGTDRQLAHLAALQTDPNSVICNIEDPRVYAATKKKKHDANTPNYAMTMAGEHREQYLEAMKLEIRDLLTANTRMLVPRGQMKQRILKGVWVFKLKRLPDLTPLKFKARFCVREICRLMELMSLRHIHPWYSDQQYDCY